MATYTTGAQFDGDQGNLSAGKLELQLAKAENALDKLEANGAVTAIVDKRTVTGHAIDVLADRRQIRRRRRAGEDDRCRLPGDERQDVDLLEGVR